MTEGPTRLYPNERLTALIEALAAGEASEQQLDEALRDFPDDPRLHFLHGSILASDSQYALARAAMSRAVTLAPDYAIARFQLGLLLLTSGDAAAAQEVWGPLDRLPDRDPLKLFARGLAYMIRDEFADAIDCLEKGIELNETNAPLNRDMNMVVAELRGRPDPAAEATSAAQLLLRQTSLKATRH